MRSIELRTMEQDPGAECMNHDIRLTVQIRRTGLERCSEVTLCSSEIYRRVHHIIRSRFHRDILVLESGSEAWAGVCEET
jgi:hypothetical protein